MSKITFRADDDLVERVESLEASKSEVMRDALRTYLDGADASDGSDGSDARSVDEFIAERVDALVAERVEDAGGARDVNVNINVDPANGGRVERESASAPEPERPPTCDQCGERVSDDHVYCPNCGEKTSNRIFCECGDELRADWAYCPNCGRRTPSADVLGE